MPQIFFSDGRQKLCLFTEEDIKRYLKKKLHKFFMLITKIVWMADITKWDKYFWNLKFITLD